MKKRKPYAVPLCRQCVNYLKELYKFTGQGKWVFPVPNKNRPMSENAICAALRYMGFSGDEMTAHGFRSMASTRLNENALLIYVATRVSSSSCRALLPCS